MTDALPRNAVLLVVDVQKGCDRFNEELHRNNPALEANIARLQRGWRSTGRVTAPRCCATWRAPTCTASSPRSWTPRRSCKVWEMAPDRAAVLGRDASLMGTDLRSH